MRDLNNIGERSGSEKFDNNTVKTTVGPPLLPTKPLCKTQPLTNLIGGGVGFQPLRNTPPLTNLMGGGSDPLWIRARSSTKKKLGLRVIIRHKNQKCYG